MWAIICLKLSPLSSHSAFRYGPFDFGPYRLLHPVPEQDRAHNDPLVPRRWMDTSSLLLGRPPNFFELCKENCWALVQAFRVLLARIKQSRAPSCKRRLQGTLSTLSSTASPGHLNEHPSAGGGKLERAHQKAAKKQARSKDDLLDSNFKSILSLACVTTQPWTRWSSGAQQRCFSLHWRLIWRLQWCPSPATLQLYQVLGRLRFRQESLSSLLPWTLVLQLPSRRPSRGSRVSQQLCLLHHRQLAALPQPRYLHCPAGSYIQSNFWPALPSWQVHYIFACASCSRAYGISD